MYINTNIRIDVTAKRQKQYQETFINCVVSLFYVLLSSLNVSNFVTSGLTILNIPVWSTTVLWLALEGHDYIFVVLCYEHLARTLAEYNV